MSVSEPASPADWSFAPLVDMAEVNPESLSAGTAADFRFQYIDLSSVERGEIDFSSVQEVTFASAPSRARRLVRPGDVLFGTVRPALQSHGAIPAVWADRTVVASTGFSVIRARRNTADQRFLFHVILSDAVTSEACRVEVGTNYPAVNEADVRQFLLPKPPLSEQHRIAEILDTINEAIFGTAQLIAKLKRVKHGLLHDLLTRGVDKDGELRDPQLHPGEFRESAIGQVPREWEVITLAEAGTWISGGTPSKAVSAFWNGSMPWVSPKDMKSLWLDRTIDSVSRLAVASGTRVAPAGSVMIVVRGMILAHSFPVSVIQRPMAFNQDVKAIVATAVDSRFLAFWLVASTDLLLGLVTESTHGTKRIELRDLLQQPIPRPPTDEQARILSVLLAQESRIEEECATLAKLQLVRQGLMDDLLTGRVRVNKSVEGVVA